MISATDNLVDGGPEVTARVRGLRAGRSAPVHLCRHCGAPLAGEAAVAAGFCCAGCSYVFRLVHDHGLEGYYRIRDAVVPPAGEAVFQPRDYTWLEAMQQAAEQAPGTPEMTLEVQGISCAGCVWLIEKIFDQQPGSLQIETDAQLGRMRLRWTREHFAAPAFGRALQSFNYLVGPPGEEPAVSESRRLVRRIGLCAAFAMNVMLFALPAYFGMDRNFAYAHLFGLLSAVFATLSVLAGGGYFFSRAFRALREGVMHIDLPIAVGILGAYAGSLFGWLTGRPELVYFDFVAGFIVLMLVGRWAQLAAVERNRRQLLGAASRPRSVGVLDPATGTLAEQPVEAIRPGAILSIRSGQLVPVEAQLESASATLGTAWITGEADPRACGAGGRVPAGAVNLGHGAIRLRALQGWSGSLLAQLLRPAERDVFRHHLLERIVRGYLVALFGIAVLTGVGWWLVSGDVTATWAAVTAVLVVSCPCAIGLAFPLADEMAAVALRRFGVFVREGDIWPRLGRVRKIIFDKTGTLTLETPVLANPDVLAALAPGARAALFTLVRDNPHPVGQSLYENLLATGPAEAVLNGEIREETGDGLTLLAAGACWSLGRPGWGSPAAAGPGVYDTEFGRDGAVLARFNFTDAIRPGARGEMAALRARGLETYILSGDRRAKVDGMTAELGLPRENGVAEVSPAGKAAWVRGLDAGDTLMLGDGANDSLAFDAALVRGTPVIHRGVLEGKADFYYLGRGLDGIRRLFEVNGARHRTQAWLLVFSIAYNVLAVGLAVAGRMNPLLAAVLMPVSSLLSLAIVLAGMRRWLVR